jgi:hypothetical protein
MPTGTVDIAVNLVHPGRRLPLELRVRLERAPVSITAASPGAGPRVGERADPWLVPAAVLFTAAVIVHNADHVRRGADAVASDVFWVGTLAIVLEVGVVALICQRHPAAPLAAAVVGAGLAVGYLVVHFLPERSWLSDSFTSATGVSPLSWFAASVELVAAVALAAAGGLALAARGGLASATEPTVGERPLRAAPRHPLVAIFLATQVIVLAVSFAQV